MNKENSSFANFLRTVIVLSLVGLSVVIAHFVQIGWFDVQINQTLGPTTLTYLASLLVKVVSLVWQFLVVVIAISWMVVKLGIYSKYDDTVVSRVASLLIVGYVLSILGLTIVNIFWTKPEIMFVAGANWTISRHIEQLKLVTEESWRDNLPSDAYNTNCESRRDTLKKKNRDYCYYSVNRWIVVENMVTTGDWHRKPVVQEYTGKVCPDSELILGCIRGTLIQKTWTTYFRGSDNMTGGDPYQCNLDFASWAKLSRGVYVDMQIGVLDHSPRCRIDNIRSGPFDTNMPAYPFPEIKDWVSS